ncbi:uncharacterized protein Z518_03527 [Rhinocladiella mackenziei CBS 650.93]|uniref:Uncharacterized protein n=1 Tax=Rhinocladiella mackenziei CBS 650.93 TaxID=1442369 RepID=A0A0D2JHQ6_9EURO|nr:uncharacterized protein Z518_03527 [Rhinocladiella mackenziei CBS 650.93]KIX08870.1 hypothetical protein Z518_03527 [Rhinocladiella mackenziei CBS 650.93]
MPSKRYETGLVFLRGWRKFDVDDLVEYRTPNCLQGFAPAVSNDIVWNNEQVQDFYSPLQGKVMKSLSLTVKEVFEDNKDNKMAVWLNNRVEFGQDVGVAGGGYIMMLWFDEKQEKVTKFIE